MGCSCSCGCPGTNEYPCTAYNALCCALSPLWCGCCCVDCCFETYAQDTNRRVKEIQRNAHDANAAAAEAQAQAAAAGPAPAQTPTPVVVHVMHHPAAPGPSAAAAPAPVYIYVGADGVPLPGQPMPPGMPQLPPPNIYAPMPQAHGGAGGYTT